MKIDSKKLIEARKRKRLTINITANHIGIPPTLLGCLESGRRPLLYDSELAKMLLKFYEVELEDML